MLCISDNYLGLEKSRNTGFSPNLRNQFDTSRHFSVNPTRELEHEYKSNLGSLNKEPSSVVNV